jgi:hypothetical protein
MTIILTNDILNQLINNQELKVMTKRQPQTNNYNYYLSPNIGFCLYNPKIIVVNPKFLVLQFNKVDNINLLNLLRNASESIYKHVKKSNYIVETTKFYHIESEQENTFSIRCYLPHVRNKYFIKVELNNCYGNEESKFWLPPKNSTYDSVILEIRNMWLNDEKVGFNLELKSIKN